MNWRHLYALMQLRLQLSRNQQIKVSKFNYYLSKIALGLIVGMSVLSFFFTVALVGYFGRGVEIETLSSIWHYCLAGMMVYWALMVLGQLQLTETVSIERMLHLPVGLSGAFLLSFIISFSNSAVWLGMPVLLGIAVGTMIAHGVAGVNFLLATVAWVFLLNTLTHLFRGWLLRVVENKRAKALVGIFLPLVAIFGFLAIISDYGGSSPITTVQNGIKQALIDSATSVPSMTVVASLLGIGGAGLFLSYRGLIRQYVSPKFTKSVKKVGGAAPVNRKRVLHYSVPFVSEGTSAVAMATYKSIMRAPEVLAALIPLAVLVFFGSPYLLQWQEYEIADYVMPWIPLGIITVTMLGFPAFIFSIFSYDRDGFRAFVLSPLPRRDILLGKNLAIGVFTFFSGAALLALFQIFFPTTWLVFLCHLILLLATYLIMCPIGNFLSIYCPVGLKRGTMQPTNAPVFFTIFLYLGILAAPFICLQPAYICCSLAMLHQFSPYEINGPAYLIYTGLLFVGAVVIYWISLEKFDQSLWAQQAKIIDTVAQLPE